MLAALLAPIHFLAAESAAEEGRKTILMMLATGGVFIGVIALGELTHWLRHRR
jgi:NhaP-type Na+/H+ or K+/H+ antiporter